MTYTGPERRDDDLRSDIVDLAAQVQALNDTIQTTFVRRVELDEYPDMEIMYARMDVLEERLAASQRRALRNLLLGVGLVMAVLAAYGFTQAAAENRRRVQTDFESCERGNRTRADIKAMGQAALTYDREQRNIVFGQYDQSNERLRALLQRLDEAESAHLRAINKIQGPIDCAMAVSQ